MPSVVGEALQAAQVTLTAAGLTVGRTINIYTGQGKSGTIVAQDPPGSSRVERDAAIDLFLSLESRHETYLMPDLIYRNYDDVRRYFESRGFRVGRVSYDPYEGLAPGTVLRQFPLAGRPIHRGDVVALTVVPPEETPVEPEEPAVADEDSDGPRAAGEAGRTP